MHITSNLEQMILENENFKLALNSALHKTDVSGSALINADCMDILPLIPDESVDIILSDPTLAINEALGSIGLMR